jgi:nucleotide-binding universal stress UspA family protein
MFKRILVPLDGSASSLEVLPAVQRLLADTAGPEVTVFRAEQTPPATAYGRRKGLRQGVGLPNPPPSVVRRVIAPEPGGYAESRDQAVERREHELLEYLADAARSLTEAGHRVSFAVRFGEAVAEITALARREDFDLIAMTTHGRSGLKSAVHGSVTAGVIRSGVAPVLVVKPNGRPDAQRRASRERER